MQYLSSALLLSDVTGIFHLMEECLCHWDAGYVGPAQLLVCRGGFSLYVEKTQQFEMCGGHTDKFKSYTYRITESLRLAGTAGGLWSKPLKRQAQLWTLTGLLRASYKQGIKTSKDEDDATSLQPICIVWLSSWITLLLLCPAECYRFQFLTIFSHFWVQGLLLGAPKDMLSPG